MPLSLEDPNQSKGPPTPTPMAISQAKASDLQTGEKGRKSDC